MNNPVYSIKCPRCAAKAVAHMHPNGKTGTYREVFIKMGVKRIVCEACGFFRDVPPEESDDYELWYATDFKGHRLWARNRSHLAFLTSWISGNRSRTAADRSAVEAFPKWMILAKNRAGVLKCLSELSNKDANKQVEATASGPLVESTSTAPPPHHNRSRGRIPPPGTKPDFMQGRHCAINRHPRLPEEDMAGSGACARRDGAMANQVRLDPQSQRKDTGNFRSPGGGDDMGGGCLNRRPEFFPYLGIDLPKLVVQLGATGMDGSASRRGGQGAGGGTQGGC